MFQFDIVQGKKVLMSFNDKNAVQAHSLVKVANSNAKYKKAFLTYSYRKLK